MCKDAKRLTLIVFMLQLGRVVFGLFRISQHEDGRFLYGPLEMMVADFFVGVTGPFAIGFFGRSDQPGIGGKVLHSWKAPDVMYFV